MTKKISLMTVLVLLLALPSIAIGAWGQQVNLRFQHAPLKAVFQEIKAQMGYTFVYNEAAVEQEEIDALDIASEDIHEVMEVCLKETLLGYDIQGNVIIIRPKEAAPQATVLRGLVVDSKGEPLPGVTVLLQGTTLGAATDMDGRFSLELGGANAVTLEFSFVGMKKKVVNIPNAAAQTETLRVVMEEEAIDVDEVVVVGYGTTKARDLTGQVASISEEQLEQRNVMNVENMMQSMAAGVVVSQSSSNPGEKIRVRVRGEASLTGDNEPLFVVDGIPVDSDVMNTIAPSDIASMDILKDASATAIYGSRGANGVVIITTKRGKAGKPTLNASYTVSTDARIQNYEVLDGDAFRKFVRHAAEQTLKVDASNDYANEILKEGSDVLGDANTDWFDELKRQGFRHDINLSLRGGAERSNYYISLGIMDYNGMIKRDDYTRYNGRINVDYDVTDFLKFGTSTAIGYTHTEKGGASMFRAIGYRPDFPVYNANGDYFSSGASDNNPVAENQSTTEGNNFSILSTSYLDLKIWRNLHLKSSLAINQSMSFSESFEPSFLDSKGEAQGSESTSRSFTTIFDNTLSWNERFNDIHALDAVIGVSFERTKNRGFGLSVKNYPMDEILTGITNATEFVRKSGSGVVYGLQSSFARINYRLMDKYLFTFTARYDGSSSFGRNNRYGFFPSGAVAWRISDETFLKDVDWLNDLKIKFSAGKTGVQNFNRGSYANKDLYSTGSYMDNPSIYHSQLANRDIRWETTVQYDFGIDFTVLDNVLSGSLAYYRKNTEDLIWQYTAPSSLGLTSNIPRNIGAVRNQGIELSLRAYLFQDNEDWKWELGLNAAGNRNKVTRLVEEGGTVNGMGVTIQGSGSQVLAEGYAMGSFFGYDYVGIIQDQATIDELNAYAVANGKSTYDGTLRPGHMLIRDVNGDGRIYNEDRVIIGSPQADVIGGLNSTVKYKRLSLYTLFGFQIGGKKLYNKTLQNLPGQLTSLIDYNLYNRWSMDNQDAKLPAMYIGDGVYKTTVLDLHNASNFRLQELRLTYEFPELWGGKYLKSGEVFFAATNLFTITKYPGLDPSTIGTANSNYGSNYESWNYPALRTFSLGLKLNF